MSAASSDQAHEVAGDVEARPRGEGNRAAHARGDPGSAVSRCSTRRPPSAAAGSRPSSPPGRMRRAGSRRRRPRDCGEAGVGQPRPERRDLPVAGGPSRGLIGPISSLPPSPLPNESRLNGDITEVMPVAGPGRRSRRRTPSARRARTARALRSRGPAAARRPSPPRTP